MGILYVAPLFLPLLLLLAAEANGFRSNHDRWPTLSEVIKGWEDHRLAPQAPIGTAQAKPRDPTKPQRRS